eukprot:5441820-Amphidinium_carterae.1
MDQSVQSVSPPVTQAWAMDQSVSSVLPLAIPVGIHWRGIMDQSVQSVPGLRLAGSWQVAHSH